METVDLKFIDSVLEKHGGDKAKIIAIMQDVQEEYRYLPQDALEYIAKKLGMSESKLYGVATFYGNFSLDAKGKYVICLHSWGNEGRGGEDRPGPGPGGL